MPRSARALADNCCNHLINRGNGRQQVFHKDGDYHAFVDVLLGARQRYNVKVLVTRNVETPYNRPGASGQAKPQGTLLAVRE